MNRMQVNLKPFSPHFSCGWSSCVVLWDCCSWEVDLTHCLVLYSLLNNRCWRCHVGSAFEFRLSLLNEVSIGKVEWHRRRQIHCLLVDCPNVCNCQGFVILGLSCGSYTPSNCIIIWCPSGFRMKLDWKPGWLEPGNLIPGCGHSEWQLNLLCCHFTSCDIVPFDLLASSIFCSDCAGDWIA